MDDGLQLDASASADPDEPTAALNYTWSCTPADTASRCPPLPNASAVPTLTLLPGALPPGTFGLGVSVSKADGEVATASVTITTIAGSVPTVSVQAPRAAKHNANEALRLLGSAVLEDNGTASVLSLAWSCTPDIGALSSPRVTRTGLEQANLVDANPYPNPNPHPHLSPFTLTLTLTLTLALTLTRPPRLHSRSSPSARVSPPVSSPPPGPSLSVVTSTRATSPVPDSTPRARGTLARFRATTTLVDRDLAIALFLATTT